MTTITVLDSVGATQTVAKVVNTGQTTGANSLPIVPASDVVAKVGDGTTTITMKAASTAAAAADPSAVVALSPNSPIPTGSNAIGAVTANAGTNLNTSALALETGGNLANAATVLGATADAAVVTNTTGTISAKLRGVVSLLVSGINATLQAGSAIIGKVGIDQTTPGTTNGVQINAALPTGTNSIGNIGTVTTVTTVAAVTAITNALPTGDNGIGRVKVTDGTNVAAVKAASTAAAATDPAMVVALSPNSLARTSTDKSGTVSSGGVSQTAIASNSARKGWSLSNLSSDIFYIRDDGVASSATTGTPVMPNQTVDDGGQDSTAAITIFAATTGDAWSAKEYT